MNYEKMVQNISDYIAEELNLTAKKKDRIRFGLEILISGLGAILASLFLAWILGIVKAVLFVLAATALLKQSSGGIHLKTVGECTFFSAIFSNLLGLLSLKIEGFVYEYWGLVIIISYFYILGSLILWSPADVEEKPIKEEEKRKTLKLISIIIASLLMAGITMLFYLYKERFSLISTSIVLGLLFQAFAINPLAYKLRDLYYKFKKEGSN